VRGAASGDSWQLAGVSELWPSTDRLKGYEKNGETSVRSCLKSGEAQWVLKLIPFNLNYLLFASLLLFSYS